MQDSFVTNAQPLLQDIATELAFVETHGAASLKHISQSIADLKLLSNPTATPNILEEISWFETTMRTGFNTEDPASSEKIDSLNRWYERLENAIIHAKKSPPASRADAPETVSTDAATDTELQEVAIHLNLSDDSDLLQEFCNEGRDMLLNIEQGVLVLEEHPTHGDTLNLVFRAFHTFKGNAGFLNLEPIKNLAHELESLLDSARRGKLTITTEIIELILAGADTFKNFLDYIASQLGSSLASASTTLPTVALVQKIKSLLQLGPEALRILPQTEAIKPLPPVPAPSPVPAQAPAPTTNTAIKK